MPRPAPTLALFNRRNRTLRLHLALATGTLLLGVGQSQATTLSFGGALQFSVGLLPPVTLTGTSTVSVNGTAVGTHLSSFTIAAGVLAGTASLVVYNAAPISGLVFAGNGYNYYYHIPAGMRASQVNTYFYITGSASQGSGAFGGLSSPLNNEAGPMPLAGVVIICLFSPCSGAPGANLVVPLSAIGAGGTVTATGAVNITAIGAPWFKNTATAVGTTTAMGFRHGPGSLATSSAAQSSGVVSLVTPVFVSTSLDAFPVVASFGRFTLHFTPEPSTALAFAVALLTLMGLSLRARRRRERLSLRPRSSGSR